MDSNSPATAYTEDDIDKAFDFGYNEGYEDGQMGNEIMQEELALFKSFLEHCRRYHSIPDICCPDVDSK